MTESKPGLTKGFQSVQSTEWTDAALEQIEGSSLTDHAQGVRSRSSQSKAEARKRCWILVLTLPVTIGALMVTIGLFGLVLQLFSHQTTTI